MGTPDYMAPEQASGGEGVDIGADIFSLGATLYKLLSGQTPYSGTSYSTLAKKLRGLKNDSVPPVTAHPARPLGRFAKCAGSHARRRTPNNDSLRPTISIAALAPLCKGSDLNRAVDTIRRRESPSSRQNAVLNIRFSRRLSDDGASPGSICCLAPLRRHLFVRGLVRAANSERDADGGC